VFYFRTWVVQKPFGIILFVTDGMITRHLVGCAALRRRCGSSPRCGVLPAPRVVEQFRP
jgi:hypothetical protein